MPILTVFSTQSSDDGDNSTSSDATMFIAANSGDNFLLCWSRFPSVTIPQSATINSAVWTISHSNATTKASNPIPVDLCAVNADSYANTGSGSGGSMSYNVLKAQSRTAYLRRTISNTKSANDSTAWDVTPAVASVTSRAGWTSGNAIVLLNTEAEATGGAGYNAYTFDNGSLIPSLQIDYTAGGGPPPAAVEPGRFFLSP